MHENFECQSFGDDPLCVSLGPLSVDAANPTQETSYVAADTWV